MTSMSKNSFQIDSKKGLLVFILCIVLFISSLLISSITASKVWMISFYTFYNINIIIPVGTSLFALTFLSTDVISEVWGKSVAQLVVWFGFFSRVLMFVFLTFAIHVRPVPFWNNQKSYESVLGSSSIIIIGGIIAYLISQFNDVFVFHYLKGKDKGRNLWKRNNLSTFSSQFLDSFLFISIAFGKQSTIGEIISMIFGQILFKWIIAVLDTPFVYILSNIACNKKAFDFRGEGKIVGLLVIIVLIFIVLGIVW